MNNIVSEQQVSTFKKPIKGIFSNDTIRTCRTITRLIGLWPIGFQTSTIYKINQIIMNFVSVFLLTFVFMSCVLHAILEADNVKEKVEIIGPALYLLMTIIKYILLMISGEKIERCIKLVQDDWEEIEYKEQEEVMTKNAKYGYYLTILSAVFMYSAGFWYNLMIPFTAETIITAKNNSIKPYPAPVYGSYIANGDTPMYEIVFVGHIIAGFVENTTTVASFSYTAVLALHACGQFDVVILLLNDLLDENKKTNKSQNERLIVAINWHLKALNFVSNLEQLLSRTFLVEVFGCTIVLCCLGYYVITSWRESELASLTMYVFVMLSLTFNVFIYCYIGDLLMSQAEKVGEQAYMIEWYRLPRKVSLSMIYVIRMSHNPAQLTAWKIIPLTMNTFSQILRSSAAYFNILWRMDQ